jgi:hypothetical protein
MLLVEFGKVKIIVFLMSLSIFLYPQISSGNEYSNKNPVAVSHGLTLVKSFYEHLLDDQLPKAKTNLFLDFPVVSSKRSAFEEEILVWKYLRDNSGLFLTDRYESGKFYTAKDFFIKAGKMISYYNPPKGKPISEGHLYITLVSTVARGGTDGVFKEISFPIDYDEKNKSYKIECMGIKVNGVLIDPHSYYKRKYELFERLGFK